MMRVIGHRGMGIGRRSSTLENTIESFKLAKTTGIDAIELDVLSTKDGKFVVCHDDNLLRLSGKDVTISQMTFAELSEIHLLNGEIVPLLYDVLAVLREIPVIIDLKTVHDIPGFIKIIQQYPHMDITVATYHRNLIKQIKTAEPRIPVLVQRAHAPLFFMRSIKKHGADGLNVNFPLIDPVSYYFMHRKGFQVQIYTLDNVFLAKIFKKFYPGVWIVTNSPPEMVASIK